ncbi:MAG: alpha/beta hydrolase [Acidimicrobiaceae bacterium]|nr:alpha/beta hydrolase [Acidimicrobiaceae bacterium]
MTLWTETLGAEVRYSGDRYRTRVLDVGCGEPLLLLHGQGGHLENFARNVRAFAEHRRVLAMDFLWHGASEQAPFDERLIPAFMEQVVDLLSAEGIDRCAVEGQSMGGWVAARLALERPDLVSKLVLTTPMGIEPAPESVDRSRYDSIRSAQLKTLDETTFEQVRNRLEMLLLAPDELDDELVAVRHAFYSRPDVKAGLRRVAESYFGDPPGPLPWELGPDELGDLRLPTLVYWGTANFSPPSVGEGIADHIPGAAYHLAEAGHWAQYERAAEHNEVVLAFLADEAANVRADELPEST